MITKCDRYWWRLNRTNLTAMAVCFPFAVLFPFLSLFVPALFFCLVCEKFLTLHTSAENQDDSLRLIMTFPFSREQIYVTYVKGLAMLSALYGFVLFAVRTLLVMIKFPLAILWSNNITSLCDLLVYLSVLSISLTLTNLLLIWMIIDFTPSRKSVYFMITFMAYPPAFCILMFLKNIILFFTGLANAEVIIEYDEYDLLKLGYKYGGEILYAVVMLSLLIMLIVFLIFGIRKVHERFAGRRVYGR